MEYTKEPQPAKLPNGYTLTYKEHKLPSFLPSFLSTILSSLPVISDHKIVSASVFYFGIPVKTIFGLDDPPENIHRKLLKSLPYPHAQLLKAYLASPTPETAAIPLIVDNTTDLR